jgi:carnitine 3-dehydrogenase
VKAKLFRQMDAILSPDVVIAPSTSDVLMTEIQALSRSPERMVVGHPFDPTLSRAAGRGCGRKRNEPTVDWAMVFYGIAGKRALKLDHEFPGFIANRLQEAVWREALHMC